jgi:hypothetical protein
VTLDRLRQLLDQREDTDLDFKEKCDLNERIDLLNITKGIAAFAAMGGHLIVGVDEAGSPSPLFDERQAALFDESILRAKISPTYLPESISLTTAVHDLDGAPVCACVATCDCSFDPFSRIIEALIHSGPISGGPANPQTRIRRGSGCYPTAVGAPSSRRRRERTQNR